METLHRFLCPLIQGKVRKERQRSCGGRTLVQGLAPSTARFGERRGLNFHEVLRENETSISGTSGAPSPTWFVKTSTMCVYHKYEIEKPPCTMYRAVVFFNFLSQRTNILAVFGYPFVYTLYLRLNKARCSCDKHS